jgi:hypothetical protein
LAARRTAGFVLDEFLDEFALRDWALRLVDDPATPMSSQSVSRQRSRQSDRFFMTN